MALFSDQKRDESPSGQPLPINRISEMKARGLSNNQIVEALQREGYSTTQIFDALHQEEIRGAEGPAELPPMEGSPDQPIDFQQYPQQGYAPQGPPDYAEQSSSGMTEEEFEEKIEEVTETIIEEKWKDFVETIEKIIEWKNVFSERVNTIESSLSHLRQEFDKLHDAILKKIDGYDRSMSNVGSQLKAMELVFKDVLPKFTENVKELSSLADSLKKKN
jgi:hypothetical protein